MGFGGNAGFNMFRIWIDDELEHGSHTNPEGGPYSIGYLLDSEIRKLRIYTLEVWGLGNNQTDDIQT